jgi:hypothetical protein
MQEKKQGTNWSPVFWFVLFILVFVVFIYLCFLCFFDNDNVFMIDNDNVFMIDNNDNNNDTIMIIQANIQYIYGPRNYFANFYSIFMF